MILHKLELTSFGKFQNKIIQFEEGFNILEGNNEIGKTTIHKFIEGMLFGFLDPTKSRRSYTSDHAKYQPKNATSYRGSMSFTIDNKQYRIDRNFDKKQSDVTIYDQNNGEDLTSKLPIHPSTKLPDISEFIGISYKLYLNTISISQLLRNTEKDLGQALIERLHNITTTKDESISIQEIQEEINKSLNEIGSAKAKTKPYAMAQLHVEKLEEQIMISTEKYKQSERLFKDKNDTQKEVLKTQQLLTKKDQEVHQYYNTKKKEQFQKADQLKKQLEQNEIKITTNTNVMKLQENQYDELLRIKNEMKYTQQKKLELDHKQEELLETIQGYQEHLVKHPSFSTYSFSVIYFRDLFYAQTTIKKELEDIKQSIAEYAEKVDNTKIDESIIEDHQEVVKLKEQRDQIDLVTLEQKTLKTKEQYEDVKNKSFSNIVTGIYYFLYVFIIGIFLQKKRQQKIQQHQKDIETAKQEWQHLEDTLKKEQAKKEIIIKKIDQILSTHNTSEIYNLAELRWQEEQTKRTKENHHHKLHELKQQKQLKETSFTQAQNDFIKHCSILGIKPFTTKEALDQFEAQFTKHKHIEEQKNTIQKSLDTVNQQLTKNTNNLKELEQAYHQILTQNNIETIDHFKTGLKIKQDMLQLQKENDQLSKRIYDLTDGQTVEEFRQGIVFDLEDYKGAKTIKELENEQTTLRKELRTLESKTYELEKELSVIEETYTDVYTLEALLKKATTHLSELEKEKQALELANDIIDELSKEIQYEFAPSLNQAISNVMNDITDGKYDELKIDSNTNIKIVDHHLKQLLEAEDFSTGTIDQIYFSMRLGLSKVLFQQNFPYILDDTFVNYDGLRLQHVLHLLDKEKRQILLFTCHKREHLISKEDQIKHHHILLS